MERKFQEELRWHKKNAEHWQQEYEISKTRRKDVEEKLEALRVESERKLKEAAIEIEVRVPSALVLVSTVGSHSRSGLPRLSSGACSLHILC
jgi:hypothetical protein